MSLRPFVIASLAIAPTFCNEAVSWDSLASAQASVSNTWSVWRHCDTKKFHFESSLVPAGLR